MNIFLILLAVAGIGYGGYECYNKYVEMNERNDVIEKLQLQASNKRADSRKRKKETKAIEATFAGKQDDIADKEIQIEELKADQEEAKYDPTDIQEEIAGVQEEIDEVAAQIEEIEEVTPLLEELSELKGQDESLADEITNMRGNIKSLGNRKDSLLVSQRSLQQRKDEVQRNISSPSLRTSIKHIFPDWGFVILGAGDTSGVVAESLLDVRRGGEKIAELKVKSVELNGASAEVVSVEEGVVLLEGDTVIAKAEGDTVASNN